jgi:signal transduction histidine kinase
MKHVEREPVDDSRTEIPADRTLAEQELINSLGWLIRLRWIAGAAMFFGTLLVSRVLGIDIEEIPLYLLGLVLLAYNVVLHYGLRWLDAHFSQSSTAYQWFARLQIGLDWMSMAVLIHFSGGVESPAIVFFLFHITIASLLLPHDKGFLYVTLAPILVGGIAFLEYSGLLPHVTLFEPSAYRSITRIAGVLFFFSCASYVMAYFSMSISRRLRRREDEVAGLYQSVRAASSTLDMPQVLQRLTEATTHVLRCKAASIRLLDEAGSHLKMVTAHGLSSAYMEKAPIDVGRALIDQEALRGRTVLVRNAPKDPRIRYPEKVRAEGIHEILSAPLTGRRGPIGVLRAYGVEGHEFTEQDAAFLGAVAAQSAVAIENAQAYTVLEDLNRKKSIFVRIVTHELRSPVQVTQNLLGLLAKDYVGELTVKQRDLVERALHRIQFLQSLVDDLLDLAAGRTEVLAAGDRAPVCLCAALREVAGRYEAQANSKGLHLLLDCPSSSLAVYGNRGELDRIMNNLIGNAVKYTLKGEVRILLEQESGFARVTISDTGIGIPEEAIPHLFDEFFRAKNAREIEERGTGLGLAIVKDLIRHYDGEIAVESTMGKGTVFTVRLPLARLS